MLSDLALWVLGATLIAGAALLLLWALAWDRARGRRRCPRCWHDLQGVESLRCSECGHAARQARQLARTRRRWRWATLGLLIGLAGAGACLTPKVRRDGWWSIAPRTVLILALPSMDRAGPTQWRTVAANPLALETESRLFAAPWEMADLWWWQRALLEDRSRAVLRGDAGEYTRFLASRFLVLLADDPLDGVAAEDEAPVILAMSAHTYGTCASYRDSGQYAGLGVMPFMTAFVRPDRFRFEYKSRFNSRSSWMRNVVWYDGTDARTWWAVRPQVRTDTLPMVLAGMTGVSMGTAHTIPRLLMPEEIGGWSTTDLIGPTVAGIEDIDGCPHYVIEGTDFLGSRREVWIDMDTFLIRRLATTGRNASVVEYEPEIDVDIDESWFTFDPEQPDRSPLP